MTTILRRVAISSSHYSRSVGITTAVVGLVGATGPTVNASQCENNKGVLDFIRRDDGTVQWDKIGESAFWDQVAKVSGQQLQSAIDSGIPTQLSYGFISGYCSGFALKKAGKVAAGIFGLGFMCLQTLSYYGYIHVDHTQIQKDIEGMMDFNKDGIVDAKDGAIAMEKMKGVLEYNLPAGSGFGAGFIGGLKSG